MSFKVAVWHHCRLLLFTKLTNDLITDVLEAYKTLKIQCNSVLECSCCILLFVGVKMLGNNHTRCSESIALHQHAPKFKALGLESEFFTFRHSEMQKDLLDEVWVCVCKRPLHTKLFLIR